MMGKKKNENEKKDISNACIEGVDGNEYAPLCGDTPEEIFVKAKKKCDDFYLQLVALSAIVAAAAITVAVLVSVLAGLGVSILLAAVYAYFSRDELKHSLGVRIKICDASITVTKLCANKDSLREAWIPDRLMWYNVTAIEKDALSDQANEELEILHVPSTVRTIEKGAFDGCDSLHTLAFEQDEAALENMNIEEELSRFTLVFGVSYPEKPRKEKNS